MLLLLLLKASCILFGPTKSIVRLFSSSVVELLGTTPNTLPLSTMYPFSSSLSVSSLLGAFRIAVVLFAVLFGGYMRPFHSSRPFMARMLARSASMGIWRI